jgi:hypothetical protein
MERLTFSITINAPKEKIWDVLWNDDSYRRWTSAFGEGCYAVSDWNEGSKVLFLSGGDGMYSTIVEKKANESMLFKHLGIVKGGIEQPLDEETGKWSGCLERYTLTEKAGTTELNVEIDIVDSHKDYFQTTFPKAMEAVKALSE